MATLYFVKDGPRPDSSGPGYRCDLTVLYQRLPDMAVTYLGPEPPEFNKNTPSKYPVRVVVEVREGEEDDRSFGQPGFYLLKGVSPNDQRLSGLARTLDM